MKSPRAVCLAFVAVWIACGGANNCASESPGSVTKLSEHLSVYHGPTNVGIIRSGDKALLIDCGEGSVAAALQQAGIKDVDELWFTHYHRDQACGATRLITAATKIRVPAAEKQCFENVSAYWNDPKQRWHLYHFRPDHLMLAEPIRVDRALADGQVIDWGPAKITVIATPGHTDGSLTYLVETDGQRTAFCGDTIYDAGKLWNLWSLQSDYWTFLGARPQLEASLKRIETARPDALVPSHGRIMSEPKQAIDLVISRLDAAFDNFSAISASYAIASGGNYVNPHHIPISKTKPNPPCIRHFWTTFVLISQDKAALVLDWRNMTSRGAKIPGEDPDAMLKWIRSMIAQGEIRSVEGLWVTHYHDDHVDGIPDFQAAFPKCPCIADRSVADVISNPLAWRLPCISPKRCRVDRATKDGESWQWHEFKLTAYHFPGHTYYHGALFAEGQGLRMLFTGDCCSPTGINACCAQNRCWLGAGVGYDRCVSLLQQLRPTHVFECHGHPAHDFTDEQCRLMRVNLAEREKVFGELLPWDHPNYGTDEPWLRCFPYEQRAKAGENITLDLVVTNHSSQPRRAACRAILPRAWDGKGSDSAWPTSRRLDWPTVVVPAKQEGRVRLSVQVPLDVKPGRYVIPVDVRYDTWALPQFTEAVVEL